MRKSASNTESVSRAIATALSPADRLDLPEMTDVMGARDHVERMETLDRMERTETEVQTETLDQRGWRETAESPDFPVKKDPQESRLRSEKMQKWDRREFPENVDPEENPGNRVLTVSLVTPDPWETRDSLEIPVFKDHRGPPESPVTLCSKLDAKPRCDLISF